MVRFKGDGGVLEDGGRGNVPESIDPSREGLETLSRIAESDTEFPTIISTRNDWLAVEITLSKYPMIKLGLQPMEVYLDGTELRPAESPTDPDTSRVRGQREIDCVVADYGLEPVGMNDDGPFSVILYLESAE